MKTLDVPDDVARRAGIDHAKTKPPVGMGRFRDSVEYALAEAGFDRDGEAVDARRDELYAEAVRIAIKANIDLYAMEAKFYPRPEPRIIFSLSRVIDRY